jgi:RHS repeat-associated protein
VRQLNDNTGLVIGNQSYDPYSNILSTSGTFNSAFGYTGEQYDASTGLEYLRARYYSAQGRFISQDTWEGNQDYHMSHKAWLYVYANPSNGINPSGLQGPKPGC